MDISEVSVIRTSMPSQALFVIKRKGDNDNLPSVQVQMPKDIAIYLSVLVGREIKANPVNDEVNDG